MILIKNTSNTVILTLKEKQTIAAPDWLFELINDLTGQKKYFHAEDISNYPDRYNKFIIIDNSSVELPGSGQMNFLPTGKWTYNVYEVAQASPFDSDPSHGNLCETGTCEVILEGDNDVKTFDQDEDKNTAVFDK